jgi:choline dehydrogenase-like flavoprotein
MIRDITTLPEGQITGDVIVIGSGIAGAEAASQLVASGLHVVLLESGRERFDPQIQALNEIEFLGKPHRRLDPDAPYHPYLPPELRGVSRVRQLGGTSNVWTGKWKYFQRRDFPERPWVPHSAWPIGLDDLLPYYRSTAASYGFGDLEAEAERPTLAAFRAALEGRLKLTSFYWEETPTRTPRRFGEEWAKSDRLTVVTGATATRLVTSTDGSRVETVICRSLEGQTLKAHGQAVILAAGAIETPRLLLASTGPGHERGIGNKHDLVGRFYTDHPKHHSADLEPGSLTRAHAGELQYGPKPRFCLCFALDDETQAEYRLLEHVVYLKPLYERRRDRLFRVVTGGSALRDGLGTIRTYRVKLVTEQVPNRDSRVLLSDEKDALGVPKTQLDWRLTNQDHDAFTRTVSLLTERFRVLGLGTFDWGAAPPTLDNMTDAAHQMGTTRMGASPEVSVTNADCRVWGTENLYVAGSAVFPTGPSYSPTYTILALARRLAEHVAARHAA